MTRTVAVLGGGQLARMLALAAVPLDLRVRVLDPAPDACAGAVAEHVVGAWDDPAALDRLAAGAEVVTCEFENVPAAAAEHLAGRLPVRPGSASLATAQDRLAEKQLFDRLGVGVAAYAPVDGPDDLPAALERTGLPAVIKTRRQGYDGKGQAVVRDAAAAAATVAELGGRGLIVEALVPYDRELSVLVARAPDGAAVAYPAVENVHRGGILRVSRAAAADVPGTAAAAALAVAAALHHVGVLALELFQVGDEILANELAPRVHNSGHLTIEAAATSQFEQHLRAVLGLPLGSVEIARPAAMVNLIGAVPPLETLLAVPGAHVHLYGKQARPGRKVGHVTLVGSAVDELDRLLALVG